MAVAPGLQSYTQSGIISLAFPDADDQVFLLCREGNFINFHFCENTQLFKPSFRLSYSFIESIFSLFYSKLSDNGASFCNNISCYHDSLNFDFFSFFKTKKNRKKILSYSFNPGPNFSSSNALVQIKVTKSFHVFLEVGLVEKSALKAAYLLKKGFLAKQVCSFKRYLFNLLLGSLLDKKMGSYRFPLREKIQIYSCIRKSSGLIKKYYLRVQSKQFFPVYPARKRSICLWGKLFC
ncbi:hypothetical protein ES703_81536 [subsurface metagenome]